MRSTLSKPAIGLVGVVCVIVVFQVTNYTASNNNNKITPLSGGNGSNDWQSERAQLLQTLAASDERAIAVQNKLTKALATAERTVSRLTKAMHSTSPLQASVTTSASALKLLSNNDTNNDSSGNRANDGSSDADTSSDNLVMPPLPLVSRPIGPDTTSCSVWAAHKVMDKPMYCQRLHAIIAGYEKNVTELTNRLKRDDTPYTYYTHGNAKSADFLGPNEGDEAHVWFRFIVDHYDHLPESVALLHDDTTSQVPQVLNHMLCLLARPSLPYTPLFACYPPWHLHESERFKELIRIFKARELPADNPTMYFNAAAYFAVGRDHIRRHPREAYRQALEWIMIHGRGHHTIGLVLEHFWHAIFGAHAGDTWSGIDIENDMAASCDRYQRDCAHIDKGINWCRKPTRVRVYSHPCGV